jgi:hypothetical protein
MTVRSLYALAIGLLAALPFMSACKDVEAETAAHSRANAAAPQRRQFIVAMDLSGSRSEEALRDGVRTLNRLAEALQPNDRLVLLRVESHGRQPGNARAFDMPTVENTSAVTTREQQSIEGVRDDIKRAGKRLLNEAPSFQKGGTDLLATLFAVADQIVEPRGETTLLLLSDMVQDSQGLRFDHGGVIPGTTWFARAKADGRVPDLHGVCVAVVGADPSTSEGIRIRQFWRRYFEMSGARFDKERYRLSAPDTTALACGSPVQS